MAPKLSNSDVEPYLACVRERVPLLHDDRLSLPTTFKQILASTYSLILRSSFSRSLFITTKTRLYASESLVTFVTKISFL